MQQHKGTNKFSEIEVFAKDSETLVSSYSICCVCINNKQLMLEIIKCNLFLRTISVF
jgi:hypothetical protein